jgi:tRNA(Ile)-lysidine synthase
MTGTAPPSAAADAVSAAEAARFGETLARLLPGGGRIGLAVSGGPDSMAMLLLAQAAIPGEFDVATVDHGLRPEAAGECSMVERACAEREIACTTLKVTLGDGNLQQEARVARYAALREWAESCELRAVATAHHADDQAETLLMRLNRGSGVAGLAGVRAVGWLDPPACELPILRPLLGYRRAELARIVEAAGVEVVQDPSNSDEQFDRVRMRRALADAEWLDPLALSASAGHLADADHALSEFAIHHWSMHVRPHGEGFAFYPLAPRIMRLRIIGRIIGELGKAPRGSEVARLLDRLEAGESGNLGGVLARVEGNQWVFRPEPPRRG